YDQVREVARRERPRVLIGGASAYARVIDFAALRSIADEVGAIFVVDMAHIAGLVAAGEHPSPVPHAQIVTTTTHKTLRGPRGGMILCTEEYAKAVDKAVFPYSQGGPLMHVIAGKAVALKEAATPEFKTYAKQIRANARGARGGVGAHRCPHRARAPRSEGRGDREADRGRGARPDQAVPGAGHHADHPRAGPSLTDQLHVSTHPLVREKVTRLRDER